MKTYLRIVILSALLPLLVLPGHSDSSSTDSGELFVEIRMSAPDSMQVLIMTGQPHLNSKAIYWVNLKKGSSKVVDPEVWDSSSWKASPYQGLIVVDLEAKRVRIDLNRIDPSPDKKTDEAFPANGSFEIKAVSNEVPL